MTPEQIELEFEHMSYDEQLKKGEVFEDTEYENYDSETDADDKLLSDLPTLEKGTAVPTNVEINSIPGDWEDVEINDFEGE